MGSFRFFIFGLLTVVFLPACAVAEGNIHIGQLKINPYVSLSESFSDNIYSTHSSTLPAEDAKKDSLTTATPGLRLSLPIGIHKTELEYYSVLTRYQTYKGENTTDYHAHGAVYLNFGSLVCLKLSDQYANGHEPRGALRPASSSFLRPIRPWLRPPTSLPISRRYSSIIRPQSGDSKQASSGTGMKILLPAIFTTGSFPRRRLLSNTTIKSLPIPSKRLI